jgi:NadR type nicotinamide-nucleotide adenylyltransferase
MIQLCFHGAESTGKSALAAKLGFPWVPEYGRHYAEAHGTDFTMADLLAIAAGHHARVDAAMAAQPPLLILDTDALMTAAWAEMLFGEVPERLLAYPKAERYLLFDAEVPWIEDGTRMFGSPPDRARFAAIAEAMLVHAGVPYERITGDWAAREATVLRIIADLT